ERPGRVWLANPHWGQGEWAQVAAQCQPDRIIGTVPAGLWRDRPVPTLAPPPRDGPPRLLIPTGGSSGNIRFASHTWATLRASVQGFQQHFACPTVNAYCVLPLYHVSGLMQAWRCLLSGGQMVIQPFRELLTAGAIAPLPAPAFLSLVPTQLQRLLTSDRDFVPWLQSFTAILLGGAPPWPSLLHQARALHLPLAPTYGMTETASQVVTLLPSEFLAGHDSSGRALPHAQVTIRDGMGQPLPPNQVGRIAIATPSLAQDYSSPPFYPGDLGSLDEGGYLTVVGRENTLIITGGEKVLPEEVEAAILKTGLVLDVAVLGLPDRQWGERVGAVVVAAATAEEGLGDRLRAALKPQLSPYKIPKHWLVCAELPRNAQGKLNRATLRQWVGQQWSATTGSERAAGDGAGE
ncbi:MAG TPA: AMP-binding protein, partial [Candidatus Obscuribacterales bacterium]